MNTRRAVFLWVAVILAMFISACATFTEYGKLGESARKNYAQGNYDQAIQEVTQALKIKPDYEEAQGLIKELFPKAVDAHHGKIKEAKSSNVKFRWDTVVSEYEALIRINQAVKSLPALTGEKSKIAIPFLTGDKGNTAAATPITFDTQDYTQALSEAKTNAAEDHYQEGRRLYGKEGMTNRDQAAKEFRSANGFVQGYKDANMLAAEGYYQEGLILSKQEGVDIQKQAAKSFKAAQEFVPEYKNTAVMYEKARKSGVKRVAIIPFDNKSEKGGYGAVSDAIVDGIVSDVLNDSGATEFLEIVSRDQLERVMSEQRLGTSGFFDEKTATKLGKLLGVHEIITGKITRISVSPERTTPRNVEQKDSVCDYVEVNGKSKCISNTVYARVTINNRKASATITGSYNVIDVKTAKTKQLKSFDGKYEFAAEWATYSGDQRAVENNQALMKLLKTPETNAPVEEDMVAMAEKDLVAKLAKALKDYTR